MAARGAAMRPYRRIATEEAWISAELLALYQKTLKEGSSNDPGFDRLWRHYGLGMSERCIAVRERTLDIGERRIGDMDAAGIDMQLLLLTSPGVQLLDADTAIALAAASNDQVSEAVRKYPDRFAALAAIARPMHEVKPKQPERQALTQVAKNHLQVWEAVEHAAGNDRQTMHAAFDRKSVIAPSRLRARSGPITQVWTGRYECLKPLKRKNQRLYARKYLLHDQRHGLGPAIMFTRSVIGAERVLYAMDYPYQYVPEEVTAMERMPLTDPDKKAFFQTNAESVFRL